MTNQQPFPRDEHHFCQQCGQGYHYHANFPATATEPPVGWRCEMTPDGEHDRPDPPSDSNTLPRRAGDFYENLSVDF